MLLLKTWIHRQNLREDMIKNGPNTLKGPLFEVKLSVCNEERNEHEIPWGVFHISISLFVMDGRTERLLRNEVSNIFLSLWANNTSIEDLVAPYVHRLSFRDYAIASSQITNSNEYKNASIYWESRLPTLPSPPDIPLLNPDVISSNIVHYGGSLDIRHWEKLKRLASDIGTTTTVFLCAVYAVTLSRFSSRSNMLLNVMHTLRHDVHPDVPSIIGNFSSTILLAINVHGESTFKDIVKAVSKQLATDLDHSVISGVELMRLINISRGSAFQAVAPFAFTSTMGMDTGLEPSTLIQHSDVRVRQVYSCVQTPQTWLDHQIEEDDTSGHLIYNFDFLNGIFPAEIMTGIFQTYSNLLEILSSYSTAIAQPLISLYAPVAPSPPMAPPRDLNKLPGNLMAPIMEQFVRYPNNIAVIDDSSSSQSIGENGAGENRINESAHRLSYRDLASATYYIATQVKNFVANKPLPRVVAVVMHKGWEQIVAVVSCLRLHATYLPIDAAWPAKRIKQLLSVSGAVCVIKTTKSFTEETNLPEIVISASEIQNYRSKCSEQAIDLHTKDIDVGDSILHKPRDMAYLIYTSGSTGKPKGVCCHHQGALNTNIDLIERFDIGQQDSVLGLSSQSFDLSVFDVFGMLGAGGTLVLSTERDLQFNEPVKVNPDPKLWIEMVEKHNITIWNTVPAFMEIIVNHCDQTRRLLPASLRLVMMSGDWIPPTLPERIHSMTANKEG